MGMLLAGDVTLARMDEAYRSLPDFFDGPSGRYPVNAWHCASLPLFLSFAQT